MVLMTEVVVILVRMVTNGFRGGTDAGGDSLDGSGDCGMVEVLWR